MIVLKIDTLGTSRQLRSLAMIKWHLFWMSLWSRLLQNSGERQHNYIVARAWLVVWIASVTGSFYRVWDRRIKGDSWLNS
eukprot:3357102-Pyramimonas_sp.AAC.1